MGISDNIREYVLEAIIEPARQRGLRTVKLKCGDIHDQMGLSNRHPQVCSAIDADIFQTYAKVELIQRSGPKQSNTATWLFKI
jgi:hypothetical protein